MSQRQGLFPDTVEALGRCHRKRNGGQRPGPSALKCLFLLGRYVEGIVHLFYQRDDVVRGDPELQAWCREITEVGLCQAQDRGKIHSRERSSSWETLLGPLPSPALLGTGPQPLITPPFLPPHRKAYVSHSHLLKLRTILETQGLSSSDSLAINP